MSPFTREQSLAVFVAYNKAVWPAHRVLGPWAGVGPEPR